MLRSQAFSGFALSGLARAFFFAGAPALLVSHWSVDDRATQTLITEVFQRWRASRSTSRAEALRQAMLGVMRRASGSTAYFAHPFAWAPFFGRGTLSAFPAGIPSDGSQRQGG